MAETQKSTFHHLLFTLAIFREKIRGRRAITRPTRLMDCFIGGQDFFFSEWLCVTVFHILGFKWRHFCFVSESRVSPVQKCGQKGVMESKVLSVGSPEHTHC